MCSLVWCLVAIGLLVFDRRLWTRPPEPVDDQTTLENGSTPVSEVLTLDGPGGRQR
jgi:hypothetical protein